MKHTISILVENEFGALARIAGLFSGRGFNIETLTVAPTLDPSLSRMTINTLGDDHVIEQIIKQLNRLINVVKVTDVTKQNSLSLTLALIKINLGRRNKDKIQRIVKPFYARIVEADERCTIIQSVTDENTLAKLVEVLKPYGIMEYMSTGNMAMQRGKNETSKE